MAYLQLETHTECKLTEILLGSLHLTWKAAVDITVAALLPLSGEGRVEGARACSHVSSQAYCPLFVWCAVQLYWPYQLIELALLKSKFRALKTKENEKNSLNYCCVVFLCLFWWFVPRESSTFFWNNGWTCSKVEKENKACNLDTHESPTRSTIDPSPFRQKYRICPTRPHKKFMVHEKTVFQLWLGQIWVCFGHGFVFKFKPKLSNMTANLLSSYDLQDKPNQRNLRNAFFG